MGPACWVWASQLLYWYNVLCHLWMASVLSICIVTLACEHNPMFSMKCHIPAPTPYCEYCMNYQIVWLSIINKCVPKALFNIPPRECSFRNVQGHCISRINVPFIVCHIQFNLSTTQWFSPKYKRHSAVHLSGRTLECILYLLWVHSLLNIIHLSHFI